jgi:hypothetical protein
MCAQAENAPAGCSKWPDFSPSQPWRAETRLSPSKAATSEDPEAYPLGYVQPLSEARTMLADFSASDYVVIAPSEADETCLAYLPMTPEV